MNFKSLHDRLEAMNPDHTQGIGALLDSLLDKFVEHFYSEAEASKDGIDQKHASHARARGTAAAVQSEIIITLGSNHLSIPVYAVPHALKSKEALNQLIREVEKALSPGSVIIPGRHDEPSRTQQVMLT